MNIPTAIKKFRKDKALSQQQVADAIKMNRVQYTRIETGKAEVTTSTLEKICKVLEVSLMEFFKEDNAELNSYDKNILEKVKLIEQLDEPQQKSLFNFIDTAISNKRLRDTLNNALSVAS
jgi:transcriptional regulator with XRE-family HTH domain